MRDLIHVLSTIFAAVAMALALAHALELPGKLRLSREEYLAVQPIYYPGFTIGGAAEPLGLIATVLLLLLTPVGSRPFWLVVVALLGLIGMQAVYWIVTHPVNRFWLLDAVLEKDRRRQLFKPVREAPLNQLRRQELGHVGDRRRGVLGQLPHHKDRRLSLLFKHAYPTDSVRCSIERPAIGVQIVCGLGHA